MQTRSLTLVLVSLATLGAVWWAARVSDEPGAAPERQRTPRAASAASAAVPAPAKRVEFPAVPPISVETTMLEAPRMDAGMAAQIARAWEPPPPPPAPKAAAPVAPVAPPPPAAPALPFRVIGQLTDAGVTIAFVQAGANTYALKPGDRVEQNYRVDEVNATRVIFTYLPLNIQQPLNLEPPR